MKFQGGYNVLLKGRPAGKIELLPEPEILNIPLFSPRFDFSEICVKDGENVQVGQVLARDPKNFSLPIIAPRAGIARLEKVARHVLLENIAKTSNETNEIDTDMDMDGLHVPKDMDSIGKKRYKLLMLGAWHYFTDAFTGKLPNPFNSPSAVVVSTLQLEPFMTRGDIQLAQNLSTFTRGLEQIQSLLEYQPIYLILPDINSEFAIKVRSILRGYAWVKMVEVPRKYAFDHPRVLANLLKIKPNEENPVWYLRTEGVYAVDQALTSKKFCDSIIISLGGPGAKSATHVKTIPGYPVQSILEKYSEGSSVRVINGGVFTGNTWEREQLGLDIECRGITILPEHEEREFLKYLQPGFTRSSYSNCFLSLLRPKFEEKLTSALNGEKRPCISCNFCEEVCPIGIMPHLIHKYLYHDALEEIEKAGVDLCMGCGLCSYVCPSKIELKQELLDAQVTVKRELHPETEKEIS